jgi:hypothetical protein
MYINKVNLFSKLYTGTILYDSDFSLKILALGGSANET